MKKRPHPWAIFFLALLLLQTPSLMAWSQSVFGGDGYTVAMTMTEFDEHHHCHDADTAPFACEDIGCVLCGFGIRFDTPSITAFIGYILRQPAVANPSAPRPEQPVELRPPRHQHSV